MVNTKKISINIICILIIIFSLIGIVVKFKDSYCTDVEFCKESTSICGAATVIVSENRIYIGDDMKNTIQIFDHNGSFIQRIKIPTNGGSFWMSVKDGILNVYSVRKNILFEFTSENEYNKTEEVSFKNPSEFYGQFGYNERHHLTLDGKIKLSNSDGEKILKLKAPMFPRTIALNFLVICVCSICLILINGLFKKSIKNIQMETSSIFRHKNKL